MHFDILKQLSKCAGNRAERGGACHITADPLFNHPRQKYFNAADLEKGQNLDYLAWASILTAATVNYQDYNFFPLSHRKWNQAESMLRTFPVKFKGDNTASFLLRGATDLSDGHYFLCLFIDLSTFPPSFPLCHLLLFLCHYFTSMMYENGTLHLGDFVKPGWGLTVWRCWFKPPSFIWKCHLIVPTNILWGFK